MPRQYEWEVLGARDPKSGFMPYLGITITDSLQLSDACEQAKHDYPAATFVKLAEGQGQKVVFVNVDEVLADA